MERFVSIGDASKALAVSITTLRRWEAEGRLVPEHTAGRHRRYDLAKLKPELFRLAPDERKLSRMLASRRMTRKTTLSGKSKCWNWYCARQGWTFEIMSDLGSGMSDYKKGLKRLLNG